MISSFFFFFAISDTTPFHIHSQPSLPLARAEHREEVYRTGMQMKAKAKSASDYGKVIAEFQKLKREYKDIPEPLQPENRVSARS